jgi:hypothetical protein
MIRRTTARFFLVVAAGIALAGCATTSSPDPVLAEVTWADLERGIRSTLVSRGYGEFDALRESGRLDPSIKIVDPEQMGALVRVMEMKGFFDRAADVSPDSPDLASITSQIIGFRRGLEAKTMIFQLKPGDDEEKRAWDRDFVDIKKAIIAVHRNTVQFTMVPEEESRR